MKLRSALITFKTFFKAKITYLIFILIFLTYDGMSQIRYEVQTLLNTNQSRIEIACSQIGVREETSRLQIISYLNRVGIKWMAPWCAAFQYWVYDEASKKLCIQNTLPRTAVANAYFDYGKSKGKRTSYKANAGDLIVWKSDSWAGHIGIVVRQVSKQTVETIEGNTSSLSVRTGGAVESKVRSIYHPIGKLKVRGLIGFSNGR